MKDRVAKDTEQHRPNCLPLGMPCALWKSGCRRAMLLTAGTPVFVTLLENLVWF